MTSLIINFSCAHFYNQPKWTEEQNKKTFGKCYSQFGHGHDYKLEVEVKDNQLRSLKECLASLKEHLDHKHLNFDIGEFKNTIPTTENLALFCLSFLKKNNLQPHKLRLFETHDLWVELDHFN